MNKIIFVPLALLFSINIFGQATLFTEDFESGSTWLTSGDIAPNSWIDNSCAGNGPSIAGSTSMYISSGGSVPGCGATGTEQHAYVSALPATTFESIISQTIDASCVSTLNVDFDYRVEGGVGTDFAELVYSTDGGTTWIPVGGELTISAVWTTSSTALPISLAGTTFELGYRFTCDDATVIGTPLAIDNIVVSGTDLIDPVLSCPASVDLIVNGSCQAICQDYTKISGVSDNCTDSSNIVVTQSVPEFTVFASGPGGFETITLTATDESGNTTQCSITINIIDTEAPVVTCSGDTTVALNMSCNAIVPDYSSGILASDNCTSYANLVFNQTPAAASTVSGSGTTPMTVTVLDEDGNSTVCNFNMIAVDTLVTQITCPSDIDGYVNGSCNFILADYTSSVVLLDNCEPLGSLTVTQSPPSGTTVSANQVITMTVTGGTPATPQTCAFTAVLLDTLSPTIVCPLGVAQYVDNSCTVPLLDYTSAGGVVVENCPVSLTVTQFPLPGTPVSVNPGELITLTVTDSAGNVGVCQMTSAIIDTLAPTIICPATQLENADASCLATIGDYTSLAIPTDNCSVLGSIGITQSPLPGLVIGTTQSIILTATDEYGNSNTCSFNVELNDIIAPTIICPGAQTVSTDIGCDYTLADFTSLATGLDNCSPSGSLSYSQSPIAGTLLPLGTNSVTITVQDTSGNSAMCSFDVIVQDQVDPIFTACPATQIVYMDSSCQTQIGDYLSIAIASDNCSTEGNIILAQSPSPGTAITTATLVTITATDQSGNTANCLINVIPTDTILPSVVCPADQTVSIDASCQYAVPDLTGLVAGTDNCSSFANMTVTQSPIASSISSGITPVLITLTDENGNATTCVSSLIPIDTVAPIITCPTPITVDNGTSCDYALTNYGGAAVILDNCPNYTIIQSPAAGTIVNPGITQITLNVTDAGGNNASCVFDLTVIENVAPTIICPSDTVSCDPVVFYSLPTYNDNCFAYLDQIDGTGYTTGSTFPVGVTVIQYAAIDSSGNMQTCDFRVEILEFPSPAIIPLDTIQLCGITTTVVDADSISSGTGSWTLLSGQGSVNNPFASSTAFNGLGIGSNVFEWTVSSPSCGSSSDTVVVIVSQTPIATSIAGDSIFACGLNSVNLIANPPVHGTGVWSTNNGAIILDSSDIATTATLTQSGWQQFNWTVSSGSCPAEYDSLMVLFTGNSSAYISDSIICLEDGEVTLTSDSLIPGQFSFWHFTVGSGTIASPFESTTLVYDLENGVSTIIYDVAFEGCPTYMDTVTVIAGICNEFDPVFPTVITPNLDGKNDLFEILYLELLYPKCHVTVFNRWGSVVFDSKGYSDPWDGTNNGEPLPMGTYFYKIHLNDSEGTIYTGDISIIH